MSTYSSNLRIELPGDGTQAGTWGDTTNSNLAYILDASVAGFQTVSVVAASQALTFTNGPTSTAASNQAVYAMLRFTTTTGAAFAVYAPPVSKAYIVWNNSGQSLTIYNSTVIGNTTAAGTGVTVTNNSKIMVWSDATNFYELQAANLTGTLAIINGGTGQTTANAALNALLPAQTNNRMLRSDGTNTSFAQVVLTTDISGVLPIANGGTNSTATPTNGGITYGTGAALAYSVAGTSGQVLQSNGAAAPTWIAQSSIAAGSATNATLATTATLATLATLATTATLATLATLATSASKLTTASGSAPSYSARAWVRFDGTGTIGTNQTITGSGNVTSVFKNADGDYTITFTTAMPNANYAVSATGSNTSIAGGNRALMAKDGSFTTTTVDIFSVYTATVPADCAAISVVIFC